MRIVGHSVDRGKMDRPPNSRIWKDKNGWQFTDEELEKYSPSRLAGMTLEEENQILQTLCIFIQDLGHKVEVTQLVINTAIVYLRRIFCIVDLKRFNTVQPLLQVIAACCLFVAAKVEEKPRKLEHLIYHKLRLSGSHHAGKKGSAESPLHTGLQNAPQSYKPSDIAECMEDFKSIEMIVIKILGFDLVVDHPHTHVVRACQAFNAGTDFAQTAYFMATNILMMTNLCVQYNPATIAAICIYLSFKWSKYEMFPSKQGQQWYQYMQSGLTIEKLESITRKLMETVNRTPDMNRRLFPPQKVGEKDKPAQQHPSLSTMPEEQKLNPLTPSPYPPASCRKLVDRDADKSKRVQYYGFISASRNQSGHSGSPSKPVPGPSGLSSASRSQPVPGPSGLSGSTSRSHNGDHHHHHRSGMPPPATITRPPSGHQQHVYIHGHGQKSDRQRSPGSRFISPVVTVAPPCMAGTTSGSTVLSTSHSSSQPAFPGHPSTAHVVSTPSTAKRLSLQAYQQRVEQRLPAPVHLIKSEPKDSMYRMQPGKPSHSAPGKSSQSSHSSPQQNKKTQPPATLTKVSVSSERSQAPLQMDATSNQTSHTRPASSHSQPQAQPLQPKEPKTDMSPLKTVKKERTNSSVPDNVHLKTAKVMVQDLKDSHGQDKVLYNEASRKRSLSQSQEEGAETSSHTRPEETLNKRPCYSQDKVVYNEPSRKRSLSQSQEEGAEVPSHKKPRSSRHQESSKKPHQTSRQSMPKPEAEGSEGEPIRLYLWRDGSKQLQIRNNEDSPTKPIKMKICRNRDTPDGLASIVPNRTVRTEEKERLTLRLPNTLSGSKRSHDKHSQHAVSGASADGHERKNKQSYSHSSSSLAQAGYNHSSQERMYRSSSSSQVMAPTLSGDNNSSQLRRSHSRASMLPHPSEFSFPEQLITPNLPDNIFDETPDVNGSYSAAEAACAGLSSHMPQMYSQSSGQQMQMHHISQAMMNNASMYRQQPPLPPPLPDNPPPPPPPPPQ